MASDEGEGRRWAFFNSVFDGTWIVTAANKNMIRAINRFKVLDKIRVNGVISRVDIARSTGLSQGAVTAITASVIKEGLVEEKEAGKSTGGRRPVLLALNPQGAFAMGVHLSIRQINVVILDFEAGVLASHSVPLKEERYSPEEIADKTAQAIEACRSKGGFLKKQISGVGIAIPGLVDSESGLIRFLPNYQWQGVDLRSLVQKKIRDTTHVENTANALAVAEQWFGEGKGIDSFIVITLERGVGMGVVINGQLYRGEKGIAGEFGHMTVDPDGPLCRCGRKGCLEAAVGSHAILRDARAAAAEGRWKPRDPDRITIHEVLKAARRGEPCLQDIYKEAGRILGIGVANLIKVFNPTKIILCGKGVQAGTLLFGPMHETIPRYLLGNTEDSTEIVVQSWNKMDYARGAGIIVLHEIYRSPEHPMQAII